MHNDRLYWGSAEANAVLADVFNAGKAVLAGSDTVWGLLAPATKEGALELDRLKKRREKPYLVLIGSLDAAKEGVLFPQNGSYELAHKAWPGPLTVLLPALSGHFTDAQSPAGVVGVRVPDHGPLRLAALQFGALFSTSANISGEPVPTRFEDIPESIRSNVGAVIYNDENYRPYAQPSTIIDGTGMELKIIRHGAYNWTP